MPQYECTQVSHDMKYIFKQFAVHHIHRIKLIYNFYFNGILDY